MNDYGRRGDRVTAPVKTGARSSARLQVFAGRFAGIIFNRIVRVILRLPFVDTHGAGFIKAFPARELQKSFVRETIERFGFERKLYILRGRQEAWEDAEVAVRLRSIPGKDKGE